tara:strand:- start:893 stop:2005 length:1113 start_codon:yes stop_codon:yes gene_type:complete
MEVQIKCFTCGKVIAPFIGDYWYYREDFGLDEENAIDKTNLQKDCCRLTLYGQTKIADKVHAAGGVKGDAKPFPNTKINEKSQGVVEYGEEGTISYTKYSRRVKGFSRLAPTVIKLKEDRDEPRNILLKMETDWDISDIKNYPNQKDLDMIFSSTSLTMKIDTSWILTTREIEINIAANQTLRTVIETIQSELMDENDELFDDLMKSNIVMRKSNELANIFELSRQGINPSVQTHYGGMIVRSFTKTHFSLEPPFYGANPSSAKLTQKANMLNMKLNGNTIIDVIKDEALFKIMITDEHVITVSNFQIETVDTLMNSIVDSDYIKGSRIMNVTFSDKPNNSNLVMTLFKTGEESEIFVFRALDNVKFDQK